ncbi:protein kinase [Microbispora sp. NPDC049125]|uniref:protein kinase domain-containing protein n=1 Tax=Microbispora sp. NPDC049125 TaxID=3154929 RepID=UPI003466A3D9
MVGSPGTGVDLLAISPLRPEDRERLGDYRLRGRISENDRSVVYAAESGSGEQAVLTLYEVELDDPDRFLSAVDMLQRLPAYYLVPVLDAGTVRARPYVVTEQVDGPTLTEEVRDNGPLAGPALHRLAVGTVTALVGVHEEGAVHGGLRPDAVLLAADGPRVAGTGLVPLLEAAPAGVTQPAEALGPLTPEALNGEPAGQPADMFAWASVMVFAATGRHPFEAGSAAASINRVLNEEPDLSALGEPLRGLVARCLAKDPAGRPTASDALLTLVGHSLLTGRLDLGEAGIALPGPAGAAVSAAGRGESAMDAGVTEPAEDATVHIARTEPALPFPRAGEAAGADRPDPRARGVVAPRGGRAGYALSLALGGLLIALAFGGGTYAVVSRQQTAAASSRSTASPASATPPPVQVVSAVPDPPTPPPPTTSLALPGPHMTLRENPADPVRLTAYRFGKDTYVRSLDGGTFTKADVSDADPAPSPDGTWVALATKDTVTFENRRTGARFEAHPGAPAPLERGLWSPDGKRYLATSADGQDPAGFVMIDPATRAVSYVDTRPAVPKGITPFAWLPDGSGVAVTSVTAKGTGVTFLDLAGRFQREMHWVGETVGRRLFSPSGRRFATLCPSGGTICLWDASSGGRLASIAIFYEGSAFWGWYDEDHVVMLDASDKKTHKGVVMDLRGREQRVIAEIAAKDTSDLTVNYIRS